MQYRKPLALKFSGQGVFIIGNSFEFINIREHTSVLAIFFSVKFCSQHRANCNYDKFVFIILSYTLQILLEYSKIVVSPTKLYLQKHQTVKFISKLSHKIKRGSYYGN